MKWPRIACPVCGKNVAVRPLRAGMGRVCWHMPTGHEHPQHMHLAPCLGARRYVELQ